jgi:hypothetical protein
MFKHFRGRRPSAPMVISVTALFFAIGGVGYAATALPAGSVGTRQLRNNAVTWFKIAPGTIGSGRINQALVQTRVTGTCSGTTGAIGAVLQSGRVTCNPSASKEFGTNGTTTAVTPSSTTVATRPLTGGTYLLFGEAYATSTTTSGAPTLTCSLAVPGGASQTRTVSLPAPGGRVALPINLASSVPATGATATLNCNTDAGTTASVIGQINAIQTSGNS